MYRTIRDSNTELDTAGACMALAVSKSGYYMWLSKAPAANNDMPLRDEMQKIATEFPRYGYRRITAELRRRSYAVNHKKVLRLMRQDSLLCARRLFKPATTDSNHNLRVYPNLAKDMQVTGLNHLWVADITYIRLETEFVYLAVIMDVFSRRCIGWELSSNIDAQLVLNALDMALENRNGADLSGLVHHSDQGAQYACAEYVGRLRSRGISLSMSGKGNPYDNAFAESLIKTLKCEEVYLNEYESFSDAYRNLKRFIEDVYNVKRIHSGIGYRTPFEVEKEVGLKRTVA